MPLKEEKPISRDLSKDQANKELARKDAIVRELARQNPKIDNNIIKGYN